MSGSFRQGPDLLLARYNHTATTIGEGRILIVGGADNLIIYVETGNTRPVLLEDIVVIEATRGRHPIIISDRWFFDWRRTHHLKAEIYQDNQFTFTGELTVPRMSHTATALPISADVNDVLIVGGTSSTQVLGGHDFYSFERYVTASETFEYFSRLPSPCFRGGHSLTGHTATLLADNTTVLIAGGWNPHQGLLKRSFLFDSNTNKVRKIASLKVPREGHSAALLADGKVLILGGNTAHTPVTFPPVEIFDPETNTFGVLDINYHQDIITQNLQNGKLDDGRIIFGIAAGRSVMTYREGVDIDAVSCSFQLQEWLRCTSLSVLRNNQILFTGGIFSQLNHPEGPMSSNQAILFNPENDHFESLYLKSERSGHTATALPNNSALVTGGANIPSKTLKSTEILEWTASAIERTKPNNIQVDPGCESIQVTWSHDDDDVTGFRIEEQNNKVATESKEANESTHTFENLDPDTEYCFQIIAEYADDEELSSEEYVCANPLGPPAPPAVVSVSADCESIQVTWSHDGVDVTGFIIKDINGHCPDVNKAAADRSHTFNNLDPAILYCFQIYASNICGNSDPVDFPCTKPLGVPDAPTLLGVTVTGTDAIQITWNHDGEQITKFRIEENGDKIGATETSSADRTHTFSTLTPDTYCFTVIAVNDCGDSLPSGEECVTLTGCPATLRITNHTDNCYNILSIEIDGTNHDTPGAGIIPGGNSTDYPVSFTHHDIKVSLGIRNGGNHIYYEQIYSQQCGAIVVYEPTIQELLSEKINDGDGRFWGGYYGATQVRFGFYLDGRWNFYDPYNPLNPVIHSSDGSPRMELYDEESHDCANHKIYFIIGEDQGFNFIVGEYTEVEVGQAPSFTITYGNHGSPITYSKI